MSKKRSEEVWCVIWVGVLDRGAVTMQAVLQVPELMIWEIKHTLNPLVARDPQWEKSQLAMGL